MPGFTVSGESFTTEYCSRSDRFWTCQRTSRNTWPYERESPSRILKCRSGRNRWDISVSYQFFDTKCTREYFVSDALCLEYQRKDNREAFQIPLAQSNCHEDPCKPPESAVSLKSWYFYAGPGK